MNNSYPVICLLLLVSSKKQAFADKRAGRVAERARSAVIRQMMVQNLPDPVNTALPVLTMGTNLNANADIPVTQPHHGCFSNSGATPARIRASPYLHDCTSRL